MQARALREAPLPAAHIDRTADTLQGAAETMDIGQPTTPSAGESALATTRVTATVMTAGRIATGSGSGTAAIATTIALGGTTEETTDGTTEETTIAAEMTETGTAMIAAARVVATIIIGDKLTWLAGLACCIY